MRSTYCERTRIGSPSIRAARLERGAHALVLEAGRQAHVDDADVGAVLVDGGQEGLAVGDRGHDLEAVLVEQAADALAQQREVLGDHDAHGTSAYRTVGPPRGRGDRQRAVERGQALVQPVEAVAGGVGAAAAVVAHLDAQAAVVAPDAHLGAVRLGVLDGVGQRLGDGEVGGQLDRRGQAPVEVDLDPGRQRRARGQRADRLAQAALGRAAPGGCRARGRAARPSRAWPRRAPSRPARARPRGRGRSGPRPCRGRARARRGAPARRRAGRARCAAARRRRRRRRRRASGPGPRRAPRAGGGSGRGRPATARRWRPPCRARARRRRAAATRPIAMARKAWPHESTWKRPSSVGSESGSAHHQAGMVSSPSGRRPRGHRDAKSAMPTGSSSRCQPRSFHVEGSEKSALRRSTNLPFGRPVDAGDRLAEHQRRAAALDPRHPARDVDGDHRDRQADERDGQAERQRPARDHHREGEDPHRQREQQVDGVESRAGEAGRRDG